MLKGRYQQLEEKIDRALEARSSRTALYRAMKRGRDSRHKAVGALPGGEGFRNAVRSVKVRCLDQQDELVDRFARKVRQRGAEVFRANDGPAAIAYILDIVNKRGARTVAKSKSLTSEEIEVNHPLEAAGVDVIETDLGELIIQKVKEKPFHLVFPAVHKTAVEVAEIFREVTQEDVPNDVDAIMRIVRKYLRPIFLNADIGMTGANVGVAETGAIVIETNEGNARLVSSIPDVHICIMGCEKIVDTVEDALQMMLAHPISAVGQHLTTYVTMMGGRSPLGTGNGRGPRESHIIILDNGRSRMREDPLFKDALNCIRCGACMNICPTYGVVGGHTFGYIYPGPIGIPWTSEVHGLDKAAEFAPLCVSCGLCKEICPAGIDIPMMIAGVKDRDGEENGHPRVNRVLMAAEGMAKFGCATAPVSNWMMRNRAFRWAMEAFTGIDRRRALPPFRRQTLAKWFRKRGVAPRVAEPAGRVVFFCRPFRELQCAGTGPGGRRSAGSAGMRGRSAQAARQRIPVHRLRRPQAGEEAGRGERAPHGALRRVGLRYRRHGANGRVLSENILSQAPTRLYGCESRVRNGRTSCSRISKCSRRAPEAGPLPLNMRAGGSDSTSRATSGRSMGVARRWTI